MDKTSTIRSASLWRRFLATLIDLAVVWGVTIGIGHSGLLQAVGLPATVQSAYLLLIFTSWLYGWASLSIFRGLTLGMAATRTRAITKSRAAPGWFISLLRAGIHSLVLFAATPLLLVPMLSPTRRSLADLVSGTVVQPRGELVPAQ